MTESGINIHAIDHGILTRRPFPGHFWTLHRRHANYREHGTTHTRNPRGWGAGSRWHLERGRKYNVDPSPKQQPTSVNHITQTIILWCGHLYRDHGCQITKTVVQGYVEGGRRRGRSRKQYRDNIKQWTKMTTSQCVWAAEDRSRWKEIVS